MPVGHEETRLCYKIHDLPDISTWFPLIYINKFICLFNNVIIEETCNSFVEGTFDSTLEKKK